MQISIETNSQTENLQQEQYGAAKECLVSGGESE